MTRAYGAFSIVDPDTGKKRDVWDVEEAQRHSDAGRMLTQVKLSLEATVENHSATFRSQAVALERKVVLACQNSSAIQQACGDTELEALNRGGSFKIFPKSKGSNRVDQSNPFGEFDGILVGKTGMAVVESKSKISIAEGATAHTLKVFCSCACN